MCHHRIRRIVSKYHMLYLTCKLSFTYHPVSFILPNQGRDDNKDENIFYVREKETKQSKKSSSTSSQTKTSKPSSKSKFKTEACSDEDRIACGRGKKLLVCLHGEDGSNGRTVCMKEKRISDHLGRHPDDYCGECIGEETTSTSTTTR